MSDSKQKNREAPRGRPTEAATAEHLEIQPDDIAPHHDRARLNAHESRGRTAARAEES